MQAAEFFEKAKATGAVPEKADLQSAFQFGVDADGLADLVLKGIKTATASALALYEEGEALPGQGAYDVVLNGQDEPVCVIKNDAVSIEEYRKVDAKHAYEEGEGDRSLAYWRQVHQRFFAESYREAGLVFDEEDAKIVLEKFHLVYPSKGKV